MVTPGDKWNVDLSFKDAIEATFPDSCCTCMESFWIVYRSSGSWGRLLDLAGKFAWTSNEELTGRLTASAGEMFQSG